MGLSFFLSGNFGFVPAGPFAVSHGGRGWRGLTSSEDGSPHQSMGPAGKGLGLVFISRVPGKGALGSWACNIWQFPLGFGKLAFFGGSDGKESACNEEIWVWSLGQEDPLEKGMTTCSSILAWRILWTEESGRLQSMGSQIVGHLRNHFECTCRQSISDT